MPSLDGPRRFLQANARGAAADWITYCIPYINLAKPPIAACRGWRECAEKAPQTRLVRTQAAANREGPHDIDLTRFWPLRSPVLPRRMLSNARVSRNAIALWLIVCA